MTGKVILATAILFAPFFLACIITMLESEAAATKAIWVRVLVKRGMACPF